MGSSRSPLGQEDMVQRVAKAIYERGQWGVIALQTRGGEIYKEKRAWEGEANTHRGECLNLARAAVEAMRMPTKPMEDAIHLMSEGSLMCVGDEYRAMIEAVLSGPSGLSGPTLPHHTD